MMYGRQPTVQDFRRLVVLELLGLLFRTMADTHSHRKSALGWGCRFLLVALLCASQIFIRSRVFERITSGNLATLPFIRQFVILIVTPVIVVRSRRKKDGSQNVVFAVSLAEFR